MDDNDSFGECNMSEEASKEVGRGKYVKHDSAKVAAPVNKVNLGVSVRKVAAEFSISLSSLKDIIAREKKGKPLTLNDRK